MDERPVAVITGASSGIGMETSLAFARKGYRLALAARRLDRLEEVAGKCRAAGAETLAVPTDVASQDQVSALVSAAVGKFGRLDVMVNNAGYGLNGRVHEISDRQMRRIFDVNFFGVFYGCKAAAPVMIRQRSGHIFNVSSVIGKRGTPLNGGYSATKFAVAGLTDSLRVEMLPHKVRVTCVYPGLTETEFFDRTEQAMVRYRSSFARLRTMMPAHKVAGRIVASVGRNRPELVFTAGGRLLVFIAANFPRLADWMLKVYYDDLIRGTRE